MKIVQRPQIIYYLENLSINNDKYFNCSELCWKILFTYYETQFNWMQNIYLSTIFNLCMATLSNIKVVLIIEVSSKFTDHDALSELCIFGIYGTRNSFRTFRSELEIKCSYWTSYFPIKILPFRNYLINPIKI